MKFSIASYSFHRLLAAGQQDMFKYIQDSKELGAAQLDPWIGHLTPLRVEDDQLKAQGSSAAFSADNQRYIAQVRAAIDASGLPLACLAVDGAHIYEPTPEARQANRYSAYRWIAVAKQLGAAQVRIDTGGTADMPNEMFEIIVDGYHDVVKRVNDEGMELLMENHWGANNVPANVVKVLEAVKGLGLLFDTNNWAEGTQEEGWTRCARYARSVHVKTFVFDEQGNDPTVDLPKVIRLLVKEGYDGVWGIESVPKDGDEYGAVQKTKALIQRILEG
jgi:sugar phosphate isomerase/epimerase